MGDTALKVKEAKCRISIATREIIAWGIVINNLQKACKHRWGFHRQTNACHEYLWNVEYECLECNLISGSKTPPVCEDCLATLVRAKKGDKKAEIERRKKKYQGRLNPPLSFRCPKCRKIHILWHEGD